MANGVSILLKLCLIRFDWAEIDDLLAVCSIDDSFPIIAFLKQVHNF